jgi:hypothetical protein
VSLTPSEALVARLCEKSFLSLWSYPNPSTGRGKELCDLLVVSHPDLVIFSVKDINLGGADSGDELDGVALRRWHRKAVEASVAQVYGAERRLAVMPRVIHADGSEGLSLPDLKSRRVHRVAVALGAGGRAPVQYGDFGKGFVHVLTEEGLERVLGELDTITDFVEYLRAKELLVEAGTYPIAAGDDDMLAVYLHHGRRFPPNAEVLLFERNSWHDLMAKPEWKERKAADKVSYLWDDLIERFAASLRTTGLEFGGSLPELERVMRVMAQEDRFGRRLLGGSFLEFLTLARATKVRSRAVHSPSKVAYVFLAIDAGQDPDARQARVHELVARCWVVRETMAEGDTVIGIATEQDTSGGFSLDAALVQIPQWTDAYAEKARVARGELGLFANSVTSRREVDEYPYGPDI